MNQFEQLIEESEDYINLRFQYGDQLFIQENGIYKIQAVRLSFEVYDYFNRVLELLTLDVRATFKQQAAEIENLKNQLNNMESCYIEKKQALENETHQFKTEIAELKEKVEHHHKAFVFMDECRMAWHQAYMRLRKEVGR